VPSPLARLFAVELPDLEAVLDSYRSRLLRRAATIRPRSGVCRSAVGERRDRDRPAFAVGAGRRAFFVSKINATAATAQQLA
jgi:hypothetical protein